MNKPVVGRFKRKYPVMKSLEAIIDDAEPGREVGYLIHEINNRIGFIRLDQIDNWYVQRMIHDAENFIETLEYFLERSEANV